MEYPSAPVIVSTKELSGYWPNRRRSAFFCRTATQTGHRRQIPSQVQCSASPVQKQIVAGLRFSAELRRKSATGGKYRRRSDFFCRPATLRQATCDKPVPHLRHSIQTSAAALPPATFRGPIRRKTVVATAHIDVIQHKINLRLPLYHR